VEKKKNHIGAEQVLSGTLWDGDGGKKVPPRTRKGGDGGWGRDNGVGAGAEDSIPAHCHPYSQKFLESRLDPFLDKFTLINFLDS
jgi:hypothetical protein